MITIILVATCGFINVGNAAVVTYSAYPILIKDVATAAPGNATITDEATKLRAGLSNTTYYVSYSDGDDNNTGLSESSPWKTLDKVSRQTFQPGNSILFKSGDTWDGTVRFYGSGTKELPINVGRYGTGGKPVIHGQGAETNRTLYYAAYSEISGTLEIIEGSYWHVSGLEITNHKSGPARYRVGIFVLDNCSTTSEYKRTPQYGITIDNCYIHDVVSDDTEKRTGGIVLMGNINEVLIDNNIIENVSVGGIRNVSLLWDRSFYLRNYKVTNNVLKNVVGDCIVFGRVENGSMEYNYVNGYCIKGPLSKNYAALWTWDCKDILIQYNEITGGGSTKDDGAPFDVDYYNVNIVIQYNYTHNNQKGISMFTRNSTGTVFRYNISINDGQKVGVTMFPYSTPNEVEAPLIYNNIIYQSSDLKPKGFFNNSIGENKLYVKFYNNILIAPNTLKLSALNRFTGGKIDGNIFVPSALINNSASLIEAGVYGENNSMLDRDGLLIPDIGVNTEPTGLITGYNTFEASKLQLFDGLGKIFKPSSLADINDGVDTETLDLGSVFPAKVDFFGNPLYKTATCIVAIPATGVALSKTAETITIGESLQLTATISPATSTNRAVTWTSSNKTVATVDTTGKVTSLTTGSTAITVETADGNKTATCMVTVANEATGIDLKTDDAFAVYPSVTSGFVHVKTRIGKTIKVVNMAGILVLQTTAESNDHIIDLSGKAPGWYLILSGNKSAKIIVRK